MPSSFYQVGASFSLPNAWTTTKQVVLAPGSGPTFVNRQLLPAATPLQPLGDMAHMLYDIDGGWLPIVGSALLGVTLGGQTTHLAFGVVNNMSVPAVLGNSCNDVATRNISIEGQLLELKNGRTIPILRNGNKRTPSAPVVSDVWACSTIA